MIQAILKFLWLHIFRPLYLILKEVAVFYVRSSDWIFYGRWLGIRILDKPIKRIVFLMILFSFFWLFPPVAISHFIDSDFMSRIMNWYVILLSVFVVPYIFLITIRNKQVE